jgi:hypothetical protein
MTYLRMKENAGVPTMEGGAHISSQFVDSATVTGGMILNPATAQLSRESVQTDGSTSVDSRWNAGRATLPIVCEHDMRQGVETFTRKVCGPYWREPHKRQ